MVAPFGGDWRKEREGSKVKQKGAGNHHGYTTLTHLSHDCREP